MLSLLLARRTDTVTLFYLGLIAFTFLGRVLVTRTRLDAGPIAPVCSIAILLLGIAILLREPYRGDPRCTVTLAVSVFGVGICAELIGLATGFPFGSYRYSGAWFPSVLLPSVGSFPLLLPIAWLLIAGSSWQALPNSWTRWLRVVISALLAATVDALMEPVMTDKLHYWTWLGKGSMPGGAPFSNSLGWIGVSAVASVLLSYLPIQNEMSKRDAALALGGQVALMGILLFV